MWNQVSIGTVAIMGVQETPLSGSRQYMFPRIPEERWQPWGHYLNARGNLTVNISTFVIASEGKTILVDTGLGDKEREGFPRTRNLIANLRAAGIQPEDVHLVINTHLHIDHVGWNTTRGGDGWRPTFPNARYLMSRTDWDYFTDAERAEKLDYVQDAVLPLQDTGQLDLVDGEHAVTSEITLIPSPGHTPGHMCVAVVSGAERAMIIGDMAHHPVQMTETEWSIALDVNPDLAAQTRARMADRMEREQALVLGGHFPPPGIGRLVRLGERRLWQARG